MTWRLVQGDTVIGKLTDYGCDMPFLLLRFAPEAGWEAVRPRFEALAAAVTGKDPDGSRFVAAAKPLQELELILEHADGREAPLRVWRNCFLHIDGPKARLRY
ncbi:hypothetical protein PV341_25435 [Streptomyces sp. PA03-1a]|nr:hypothetical protein [Streptomyces sp. PA03-1a]